MTDFNIENSTVPETNGASTRDVGLANMTLPHNDQDMMDMQMEEQDADLIAAHMSYLTTHFPDQRYKHGARDHDTLWSNVCGDALRPPVLVKTYREGKTIQHDEFPLAPKGRSTFCQLMDEIYDDASIMEGHHWIVTRDACLYLDYDQVVPTDTPHVWRAEGQYTVDHGECDCQTFRRGWCGHEFAVSILESILNQIRLPPWIAPAVSWYEEL